MGNFRNSTARHGAVYGLRHGFRTRLYTVYVLSGHGLYTVYVLSGHGFQAQAWGQSQPQAQPQPQPQKTSENTQKRTKNVGQIETNRFSFEINRISL